MGYIARGLYRELLDEQWVKGGIPEDMEQLALICDCPVEVMQAEWPKIAYCFPIRKKGLLMNGTLESMRTETDTRRTKRVIAGAKGGVVKAIGISANVAGAKHLPEATKHVQANPSNCHIGEKSREEKSKEEKPSRRKTASDVKARHSSDPRHTPCKDAIFAYYRAKNNNEDPDWNGREGDALAVLLQANPKLTSEGIGKLLGHRARSEVNHSERPSLWIPRITSYRNGPLNKYGLPLEESDGRQDQKRTEGNAGAESSEDGPDLYAALYGPVEQGKLN